MKKLLVISRTANRSGAPRLLLNLLALLAAEGRYAIDVVVKEDGPLTKDFAALAATKVLARQRKGAGEKLRRFLGKWQLRNRLHRYDVIISNTINNGNLDALLSGHKAVVTYVHELAGVIEATTSTSELAAVFAHTRLFLVPSASVKHLLTNGYGVDKNRIAFLPYHVPDCFIAKQAMRTRFRKLYTVGENEFVVCGTGWMNERKGIDLFLQTALLACQLDENICFFWCGGKPSDKSWQSAENFIQDHHLQDKIFLVPETDKPEEAMAGADLFFLSSREDPYPLVMLEAAMLQLPLVYFSGTGGADEFGPATGALTADNLDVEQAARHILTFRRDGMLRKNSGRQAREKYLAEHAPTAVLLAFEQTVGALLSEGRSFR